MIHAAKSYGGKLFFLVEDEGRESTEQHAERTYTRKGIFAYDYATKKTQNISSGDITDYTVDEVSQTLYYYVLMTVYINVNCRTARRKESIKWSKMKQISASFPLTENIYI